MDKTERTYAIKEIFGPTLQGEGAQTGKVSIFVRFAGCNVWNGSPETKAASACPFCDTDFVGGTRMDRFAIMSRIAQLDPGDLCLVVLTGGEPLLQVDEELLSILIGRRSVAIETNGLTKPKFAPVQSMGLRNNLWITLSPKCKPKELVLTWQYINEIKLLHGGPGGLAVHWEIWIINTFIARGLARPKTSVQPIAPAQLEGEEYAWAIKYSLREAMEEAASVGWRVSVQVHKAVGLP